jgi:hypothetical protein
VPSQRRVETAEVKVVWWVRREPSVGIESANNQTRNLRGQRTNLLKLGHGLIVLPVQLCPFREVVLGRRVPKLTLELHNLLLELLRLLRRARGWRREFVVENP